MKGREIVNLGMPQGPAVKAAILSCAAAYDQGWSKNEARQIVKRLIVNPQEYLEHEIFGPVAALLARPTNEYDLRDDLTYAVWGTEIEDSAHDQMRNACRLPIAVAGALMPDAHTGYGLPIGGVLATDNAVIPYAVGVDIACRVMLTVFDRPADDVRTFQSELEAAIEDNTRFGVGAAWEKDRLPYHEVMDESWNDTPVTRGLKDKAWTQLGTSGSGNHFVEFGEIEFGENDLGVEPGTYLALLSHSGSRGPGSTVANHYSRLAMEQHPDLPKQLRHLAWLDMDGDGAEYWDAMQLMGRYASANHHVIHDAIMCAIGGDVITQVENHHNFAWKETHDDRDVIVHRKGATPAGDGTLGFIPGTMADPGYLVRGKGDATSLNSAAHGAGRRMSRKAAKESIRWKEVRTRLEDRGVHLLSAGLDESPHAYKNIENVLDAQADLVERVAKFMPRIVKMAGE